MSRWPDVVTRWYGRGLILLPRSVRDRYSREMLSTFDEAVRHAERHRGHMAAGAVAARMFLDLMWRVVFERSALLRAHPTSRGREAAPHAKRRHLMNTLFRDVTLAVRTMGRNPIYAIVIIVTLALGIGANTAIFAVVRGVMLRPLAFHAPDRLAAVWLEFRHGNGPGMEIPASEPEFLEFADQTTVFESITGYWVGRANLGGIDQPVRVGQASVTANFFQVLGVAPLLGRTFIPGDDRPGAEPVALIGYRLWQQTFGGDPGLVGRSVALDGDLVTVVGVLSSEFRFPGEAVEVVVPNTMDPGNPAGRSSHYLSMIGRLRSDMSIDAARRETAALLTRWERENPGQHSAGPTHPVVMTGLRDRMVGDTRPALVLLAGAVSLVLLIACANVANLMLAHTESARRDLGIRSALGASRGRLVGQTLTESVLLALCGGVAGLGVAGLGIEYLMSAGPIDLPRLDGVRLDAGVLGFTLVAALVTGLLFGTLPALGAARGDPGSIFRLGAGGTANAGRMGFRKALVVAEVALAVMLVVGAGLLIRSLQRLHAVETGFHADGVTTYDLALNQSSYASAAEIADFHTRLVERVMAVPGVTGAGAIRALPLRSTPGLETMAFLDRPVDAEGNRHANAQYQIADYGYFDALSIPLVRGRLFREGDVAGAPPVAVINEALARYLWPDADPIGERVQHGMFDDNPNPILTIVGVVGDVRQAGLDGEVAPQLFVPRRQAGAIYGGMATRASTFVVRSELDPAVTMRAVQQVIRELDASLPVSTIQTMHRTVANSIADRRLFRTLLTAFAALALGLGAVGIYGLTAYTVAKRTREIGLRIALGADQRRVLRLVSRQVVALTGIGVAAGLIGAVVGGRLLGSFLFETSTHDPVVFLGAPAVLLLTSLVAAYLPARRAARVDPMVAIRAE